MTSEKNDDVNGVRPGEGAEDEAKDESISDADILVAGSGGDDVDDPDADGSREEANLPEETAANESDETESEADAGAESGPDADEPDADEPDADEEDGAQMSLLDHLGELRARLTRSFIAVAVGMVACYGFADKMFDILMAPMIKVFQKRLEAKPVLPDAFYDDFRQLLTEMMGERGMQHVEKIDLFVNTLKTTLMQAAQDGHFQYTYPAEAFFSHIKIAIVAGLFLVSPYVFAQIWGFIAPGLYAHERKWMIPMAMLSGLFFTGGALFGYFQVFPYAFDFFAGFSTEGISFTPKLNEYLSFCLKLLFAFGFVFELPLFIFFLARLGLVSSTGLRQKRKYAILTGFIMAAVLTPPDPFTQCLMAGPLIILYEVGVWVAFFFGKKEKRHLKKQAEEEAAKQAELDAIAEKNAASDSEDTTEKA